MITRSLILIRGLPGSGKSTLAQILSEDGKYPVFSIDSYFTDENGNYSFDFRKNHLAYSECERKARNEMLRGTSKIFIDNTFTLDWELEPYFRLASDNCYTIFVFTVENYHNGTNVHGIPDDHLRKMASKFRVKLLPE